MALVVILMTGKQSCVSGDGAYWHEREVLEIILLVSLITDFSILGLRTNDSNL